MVSTNPSINRFEQFLCMSMFVDSNKLSQLVPEIECDLGYFQILMVLGTLSDTLDKKQIFLWFMRNEYNPDFSSFRINPDNTAKGVWVGVKCTEFRPHEK